MSDAWDEIQAIKSKRNSLREKLEKRKKERQDIFGTTQQLLCVKAINSINDNKTIKILNDSSSIIDDKTAKLKTSFPIKIDLIETDTEIEKTILQLLSSSAILLPINSIQLTLKIEKFLERCIHRDTIHYILNKFSSQSIVNIKKVTIHGDEFGYELISVDYNAVLNRYREFMTENTFSKVENEFKRKHESEDDDDENSRKSFKSDKRITNYKESSNDASDIMSLLSMPSTREKQSKQVGEEILELLTKPTAKERSLAEKFKSHGGAQVMEFCPHGTRIECLRAQQTTVEMQQSSSTVASNNISLNNSRKSSSTTIITDNFSGGGSGNDNVDELEENDKNEKKNGGNSNCNNDNENKNGNADRSVEKLQNNENNGSKKSINNGEGENDCEKSIVNEIENNGNGGKNCNNDNENNKNDIGNESKNKINQNGIIERNNSINTMNNHQNGVIMDKCRKLHFKKIIQSHTDESLGDCSFLNTCFHMTTCKYVHYEVDMNSNSNNNSRHEDVKSYSNTLVKRTADPSATLYPPQWIQCDLRYLDMTVLGKFAVVMADPPWDIHMELPYGTMSDDEMRQLGVPALQDDGLIFLWVTGRAMELGRECLKLWGYERVDELIWVKTNQLQRIIRTGRTGHWLNHGKEHCLVGMKGNPKNLNRGLDCDVIVAEVRATSHKPDEIYGIIERLSPGTRKIELFGRPHNVQPNWITLGNQLDGIRLVDPELIAQFQKRYPDGNCMAPASATKK